MLGDKKKAYNFILDKDVKNTIDELAKAEERSTSWYINNVLKKHIKELEEQALDKDEQKNNKNKD